MIGPKTEAESHELSMSRIAAMVRERGIPCFVDQTGGGTATIYAGCPTPTEDGPVYPVSAGPGSFWAEGGPTADDREFACGVSYGSDVAEATWCEGFSEAQIAAEIVRYMGCQTGREAIDAGKAADLQAAADRFAAAALGLNRVWERCVDYPGDAFENYPANWPSFHELALQAADLKVREGYRFGTE